MNNIRRNLSLFSIICLSVFAFFSLILGWINPSLGQSGVLLFVLLYCCAFAPLSLLSASWLIWIGRDKLSSTLVWSVFQLIFIISMAMYTSSFFGLFFSSLLIVLFPLLGFVDFLYTYQNGFSLRSIALGSIGFIWSILFAWRVEGNLIDAWIETLATGSNNLWLLNALMYGFGWIVIAGIAAFVFELLRVLSKEYQAN